MDLNLTVGPRMSAFLGMFGLGISLAGCSEPCPAPLRNEFQLPPNQRPCAPGNHDSYCLQGQATLQQMQEYREEGHHTDQTLFLVLAGATIFSTVGAFFAGRRLGKRSGQKK